jgi:hypothetical protein
MAFTRPAAAIDPRVFGRRSIPRPEEQQQPRSSALGDDLRLFAATFVAGFLFVSVLIG